MWSVVAIFICLVTMLIAYIVQSALVHSRAELKKIREEIDDAERELEKALADHPEDCVLHASLGKRLNGLRKREADLL
jgi:predicted Holliday junction resolvase-like endonuclease